MADIDAAEAWQQKSLGGRAEEEGERVPSPQARAEHREGEVQPDGGQVPGRPSDTSGRKFNSLFHCFVTFLTGLRNSDFLSVGIYLSR